MSRYESFLLQGQALKELKKQGPKKYLAHFCYEAHCKAFAGSYPPDEAELIKESFAHRRAELQALLKLLIATTEGGV